MNVFKQYLHKIQNLPKILRIKIYPVINRWLFSAKGVDCGKNLQVYSYISIVGGVK